MGTSGTYLRTPREGGFYVIRDACACGPPPTKRPTLVGNRRGIEGCFFQKQPSTPSEVDDALLLLLDSCCSAYRYSGVDLDIRRRLGEQGRPDLCDSPLLGCTLALRNSVRFSLESAANDAVAFAQALRRGINFELGDAAFVSRPRGNAARASLSFTLDRESVAPEEIIVITNGRDKALAILPMGLHWSLAVHDSLVSADAQDLCWFSTFEWNQQLSGWRLPY